MDLDVEEIPVRDESSTEFRKTENIRHNKNRKDKKKTSANIVTGEKELEPIELTSVRRQKATRRDSWFLEEPDQPPTDDAQEEPERLKDAGRHRKPTSSTRRGSWILEEQTQFSAETETEKDALSPPQRQPDGELDQSVKTEDDEDRPESRASALDLSMSMRDRLRLKAKTAVDKKRGKARITRRLSRQLSSVRPEPISADQEDVEAQVQQALERSFQLRQKLESQTLSEGKIKQKLPSAEAQFDFFTKCYDETKKHLTRKDSVEPIETAEEGSAPKTHDYTAEEQIQRMMKAKTIPYFQQVAKESALYFTPSFLSVPMNRKVEADLRNLEEEGLYTGQSLNIPDRNINVMEQRLLNQPDMAVQGRRAQSDGMYLLDVDVSKLLFTHHHLFSRENLLTSRLMQLFRAYLKRSEENLAEYFSHQLHALKNSVSRLESPDAEKLNLMRKEVRELRRKRNNEEMLDRKLIRQILDTWTWLKELRQKQGYTTTSFQLLLKKEEVKVEEDKEYWEWDLRQELDEAEEDFRLWKEKEGAGTSIQFHRNTTWKEIASTAVRNRRNPGEPKLRPLLAATGQVTPLDQCPQSEKNRRTEIGKTKVCLKIFFNNLEVCRTPSRQLNADFCLSFGQIYSMHVFEWPQTIKIKILESNGRSPWEEICEIGLPVPKSSQLSSPGQSFVEEIEFSSPVSKAPLFSGVGSGFEVTFGIDGCQALVPRTSGVVQCVALWGRAKDGTPLVPPGQATSLLFEQKLRDISPKNLNAIRQLQELLKESKFDPNDPVNSHLLSLLQDIESNAVDGTGQGLDCFRLEPEECSLISEEEFQADQRFKLLELRREGIPEFRNLRMIPPNTRELDPNVFKGYEKRLEKEREGARISDVDGLREAGNKYLTMVRAEVVQRLYSAQLSKSIEDVISEEPVPSFGALGLMIIEEPGRPLKPVRREAKRVAAQNLTGGQVKILINVQSAANVPARTSSHGRAEEESVEPFMEVTFQGSTVRTSVVPGTRPTWNQHLALEFRAPNEDYSTTNLQTVNDVLYFNLFDQVVSGLTHDDREENHTIHRQVEKRWLGTMQLPFSTLYFNGKIDGSFRLKIPPVFLGYSMKQAHEHGRKNLVHPYVKLLVAIEPQLTTPDAIQGKFESIESEELVKYCDKWARELESRYPKRRYLPLVLDTNGRTVLITRFLKSFTPPPEIQALRHDEDLHRAADVACRIVSLIPFVADPVLFPGMCDIWSTCDQFLNMLCGDEEEHAVLLWSWLTGLGFHCFLLIGNGLPEGPRSAYVLIRSRDQTRPDTLYNASDGSAYSVNDPYCPLHVVGCIVNQENVWGNIQEQDHPSMLSFDVQRSTDWKPLFSKTTFPNLGFKAIQPEALEYIETDPSSVTELKGSLEREIKHRFDKWRQHGIPSWNFHAAKTLRDLLPLLESGTLDAEEHGEKLKPLTESYKMCGFPLNMGYESKEKVMEAVRATNVHLNFNPGVEFALAVHVHPYNNNILSVWVYIASLIKLR